MRHPTARRPSRRPAAALLLALAAALPAAGQIPEKLTNLKVLPKDVPRAELIETMRGFSFALGVRCTHCHVGEEGKPSTDDFAADDKEPKRVARAMMEMTRKINAKLLPKIGRAKLLEVACVTCHHGLARPQTLADTLAEELAEHGIEAALARYGELRQRYYGSGAYDFGEWRLIGLAERLAGDDPAAASAFLELNLEQYPASAGSHLLLGDLERRAGHTDAARSHYQEAAELAPNDPRPARRLAELEDEREDK